MGPRKKITDIGEQLRKAIKDSGLTAYALAKASGVSSQQIGRFMADERELGIRAAGKLAIALDLQLSPADVPVAVAVAPVAVVAVQDSEVLAAIKANTKRTGAARLADVFRALQASMTLGTFHDAIRGLRTAGKVDLSPWTGAAYQLKDGEACIVQGAEVMAFVSLR